MSNKNTKECAYCGVEAYTRDHVIPVSNKRNTGSRKHAFRNDRDNLAPACSECNNIASDHVFESFEEKRDYVRWRLRVKYRKVLLFPDWTEEEIKELGYKLREKVRIKMEIKKWVENRLLYPDHDPKYNFDDHTFLETIILILGGE